MEPDAILGMSYGITGNLKAAKETFQYGIIEDPEYPMLYYNMEKAIEYLWLAFARKGQHDSGGEIS